jgi:hypothetical protein
LPVFSSKKKEDRTLFCFGKKNGKMEKIQGFKGLSIIEFRKNI